MARSAAAACPPSAPAANAKRRVGRASAEKAVDEPLGQAAAAVADHPFAVDPVTAAGLILDAIIIAQTRGRSLAPPFGRDPLRPLDAGDVVNRSPTHEAARNAFGRGI